MIFNNTQLRIVQFSKARTLTLQYVLIGIAPDYPKVPYALQVRAEGQQFLFSCTSLVELQWFQMSFGIALLLDLRAQIIESSEQILTSNEPGRCLLMKPCFLRHPVGQLHGD